jgi:hypothetical protein
VEVSDSCKGTDYAITSGAQARLIKGVGQSMADRVGCSDLKGISLTLAQIDEFIKGGPGRLYYENTEQMQTVQLFKDIYGVGERDVPRSAKSIRQNLRQRTVYAWSEEYR